MNPLLIALRLILPISILRFPLLGGAISILLDNIDWYTKEIFNLKPLYEYQVADKALDTYYLSFLAIVALRLKNHLVRNVLIILFLLRVVGFVLFELTQIRLFLFLFPNIFENLFFFYLIIKSIASYEPKISHLTVLLFVLIVSVPKMMHEYSIHIIQKPLEITFLDYSYIFEGAIHQVIYIVIIALMFGIYYRYKKNKKNL